MAEFLIQGETLEAAADTIRECLQLEKYLFKPSVIDTINDGMFVADSVTVYYKEYVDDPEGSYDGRQDGTSHGDTPIAYAFLENNEGVMVPVLYDTSPDYPNQPDTSEPFFYVGTATIDGQTYDKWRKIELQGDGQYTWDSDAKQYLYTNKIVIKNGVVPTDMPDKIREVYDAGLAITDDADATAWQMVKGATSYVKRRKISGLVPKVSTVDGYGLGLYNGKTISTTIHTSNSDEEIPYIGLKHICNQNANYPHFIQENSIISVYTPASNFGNATAADVRIGRTFTSGEGLNVEGALDINETSYNEGYTAGHETGYTEGHDAGYEEGYTAGHETGHSEGRTEGYEEGYEEGKLKTCMTWKLSQASDIPLLTTPYHIDFISNGEQYTSFNVGQTYDGATQNLIKIIDYRNGTVLKRVYTGKNWIHSAYQTVAITGGADANNPEVIAYFNNCATLQF